MVQVPVQSYLPCCCTESAQNNTKKSLSWKYGPQIRLTKCAWKKITLHDTKIQESSNFYQCCPDDNLVKTHCSDDVYDTKTILLIKPCWLLLAVQIKRLQQVLHVTIFTILFFVTINNRQVRR